mmetsp:Transcript_35581/g.113671  ORF Transcript_35581/g.113671 Transcript_35581/m.113671 type:complete len:86 (-) Transcript_35581:1942-2199(-)
MLLCELTLLILLGLRGPRVATPLRLRRDDLGDGAKVDKTPTGSKRPGSNHLEDSCVEPRRLPDAFGVAAFTTPTSMRRRESKEQT